MIEFLSGYKTYITVGLAALAYAAFLAGFITEQQLETILMGLGIPAVGFLRAAIEKTRADKILYVRKDAISERPQPPPPVTRPGKL